MNSATINAKALKAVLNLVPRRSPRPALKQAVVSCNGSAVVRFTDQEIFGRVSLACDHSDDLPEFTLALPAAPIIKAINTSKAKQVTLSADGSFQAGSISSRADELAPLDEMPEIKTDLERVDGSVSLDAADLRRGLKYASIATDPESSRYALGGILLKRSGELLDIVATDSRRLLLVSCNAPHSSGLEIDTVIPTNAVAAILALMPQSGRVDIFFQSQANPTQGYSNAVWVRVAWDGGEILTRTVEGRFPQYQYVVPALSSQSRQLDFLAGDALPVLKSIYAVTTDDNRGADFSAKRGGSLSLSIHWKSSETGSLTTGSIPLSHLEPDLPTITLDPRFLVEFVALFPKREKLSLSAAWKDPSECPVRIDGNGVTYVVMPLSRDR